MTTKPITYVFAGLAGGSGDTPNPLVSYGVTELARKLEAPLEVSLTGYDDVDRVTGEIIKAHAADLSRPICLIGHSNGGYAVLVIANRLAEKNIPVAYLGIIELTAKASPAVPGNVVQVDHFEAVFSLVNAANKLVLSADFQKNGKFNPFTYPATHVALAAHAKVHARIVQQVVAAGEASASVPAAVALNNEFVPFYMGTYKPITDAEIALAAKAHDFPEAHVRAFLEVESNGRGSETSGALRHLYEPHVMWRNLQTGANLEVRHLLAAQGDAYPDWRRGVYPENPYPRTDRVFKLIAETHPQGAAAATELVARSCSWGLGQILGENCELAGFDSATAMVEAFKKSEAAQLDGMLAFIESKGLSSAMRNGQWVKLAVGYNGAGQAKHNYSGRLQAAAAKWKARLAQNLTVIPAEPATGAQTQVPVDDDADGSVALPPAPSDGFPAEITRADLGSMETHALASAAAGASAIVTMATQILEQRAREAANVPQAALAAQQKKESEMDLSNIKKWWQSKGVNGGIGALISMLLVLTGYDVPVETVTELGDKLVELFGIASAIIAIWGRVSASKAIG